MGYECWSTSKKDHVTQLFCHATALNFLKAAKTIQILIRISILWIILSLLRLSGAQFSEMTKALHKGKKLDNSIHIYFALLQRVLWILHFWGMNLISKIYKIDLKGIHSPNYSSNCNPILFMPKTLVQVFNRWSLRKVSR